MWNVSNQPNAESTQFSPVLITASDYLQQAPLYQQNGNRAAQQAYDTAIDLAEAEIQNSAFNQAKEGELISLYLKYANFLNTSGQSTDKVKTLYDAAVQRAEARQQRDPADPQEKAALLKIYEDWSIILVACGLSEERSNLLQKIRALDSSPLPNHALSASAVSPGSASALIQTSQPTSSTLPSRSVVLAIQTKGELLDYLFEKMFSTLGSLKVSDIPSLFLVYAHDNSALGQAEAGISRYLIDKLKQIQVLNLYSDQTPLGQPYSDVQKTWKQDDQLSDILTSQLCLLPDQLSGDVELVDKVVVCCSEVLGKYLTEWPHYGDFYQALQKAYEQDLEQKSTSAIREVVKVFSQEKDFHHVLTEMAFLQIRAKKRGEKHGIIPVPLTPNSYERCLVPFIPTTTVRMEDIPRLESQAKAGQEIYPNQGRHGVLFKLIERLLVGNKEAQTFLDNFWKGYSDLLAWLKNEPSTSTFGGRGLELIELVDRIFGDVEKELHKKLFATTQQFCDSGWQQAAVQLLDQLQHLFPLCMQNAEALQRPLPPRFSSIELREALRRHDERSDLSIQRVSGETASLEDCYINLAIVESQAQRDKDREELEKQAAAFNRLPSGEQLEATNQNKLISLDQLFARQKLRDGSEAIPKRILIQGRAGIGKTTLCKKLVYEYHHNKLWQDQFDCVLWVPLRQLKTHLPTRFEDLFCKYYFIAHEEDRAKALAKTFYAHRDKTLFILDGLDEVIGELDDRSPLKKFLEELLNQKHVVITSRPAGVDTRVLGELDLELETIGFSPENVHTYIEKFAPESNQAAIQEFINRTPVVQSLVNIPIQLDALCYSWDRLPKHQAVTMSMLYEAMVDKLWRKDSIRLEKKEEGQLLGTDVIDSLSEAELEELMTAEVHYLGYLAFKGLEAGQIEFSRQDLGDRRQELNKSAQAGKIFPISFTTNLKKTSYLHTADAKRPEGERRYHFLHLTFQEFFAATFLTKHLQAYAKVESASTPAYVMQKSLSAIPDRNEVEAFIATNKYNPRYEIVWRMVAGLLKGAALENFFHVLIQAPRDLIGVRHQLVMLGCLQEAQAQLKDDAIKQHLENEARQWLEFEVNGRSDYSRLGSQRVFPEHLLLESLSQAKKERKYPIMLTLGKRPTLSDKAVLALMDSLKDEDEYVRSEVENALGRHTVLPTDTVKALIDTLKDENWYVRSAAAKALGSQTALSADAIKALIGTAQDESEDVVSAAGRALHNQTALPLDALKALIAYLKDEDEGFRYVAARLLGKQTALSLDAVKALIDTLKDEARDVRSASAMALGNQTTLSPNAVRDLMDALKDEDRKVRSKAAEALGKQTALSLDAVKALIDTLKDENWYVRSVVAGALGNQITLSLDAVKALIDTLKDEARDVRSAAAKALGNQTALSPDAVKALIDTLKDKTRDRDVRSEAAEALGKQTALSLDAVKALIDTSKDRDWEVGFAAARGLAYQTALSPDVVKALMNFLTDGDWSVRFAAAGVLGRQTALPLDAVKALIDTLKDESGGVRSEAARALGLQTALPLDAVKALIDTLKNENWYVRSEAAKALGNQTALSPDVVKALIDTLKDENWKVRSAAARALKGYQAALPPDAVMALIDTLKDENWEVGSTAARALGNLTALSTHAVRALIVSLKDEKWHVRSAAAEALGNLTALSTDAVKALTASLKDEVSNVSVAAANALSRQIALPTDAVKALIAFFKNENGYVRSAAASVLGSHMNRLFTMFGHMERNQVEALYTQFLFPLSCKQILSLYIQANQLHFYTATGPGQPVQLTAGQCRILSEAFTAAQTKAGIPIPNAYSHTVASKSHRSIFKLANFTFTQRRGPGNLFS